MKAALVGLGRMGMRHLQVLQDIGLDVAGVCDVRTDAADPLVEKGLQRSAVFTDAVEMLDKVRPDVAVISTTAPSHEALVVGAAKSGTKYILCEKPMSISIASCARMVAACEAAGAHLAINHQMRFMEQYTVPKALMAGESMGGLESVLVAAGNFGISMNGSHYIEMLRYLSGSEPRRVSAWFAEERLPNPRGPQFEDRAGAIRIETDNGVRFYMDCGPDQGHGMFVSYSGRFGRMDVDELAGHSRIVSRLEEHRTQPTTRYGMPYSTEERAITPADAVAPTRAVLESLLAGAGYPSGREGKTVVETLVAAYVSHEAGGQPVTLGKMPLPEDREFPWA